AGRCGLRAAPSAAADGTEAAWARPPDPAWQAAAAVPAARTGTQSRRLLHSAGSVRTCSPQIWMGRLGLTPQKTCVSNALTTTVSTRATAMVLATALPMPTAPPVTL